MGLIKHSKNLKVMVETHIKKELIDFHSMQSIFGGEADEPRDC